MGKHPIAKLPIANWSVPATEFGIAFCTEVKILGISFGARML
jgi:hypothetical protein